MTGERDDDVTTADIAGRSAEDGRDTPLARDPDGFATGEEREGGRAARTGDIPAGDEAAPLLGPDETEQYGERWSEIQAGFVDQPRQSVEQADQLVADLMQRLAAQFSEERASLEQQWDSDEDVSTEDLRVALTRYRSFFVRLLSA